MDNSIMTPEQWQAYLAYRAEAEAVEAERKQREAEAVEARKAAEAEEERKQREMFPEYFARLDKARAEARAANEAEKKRIDEKCAFIADWRRRWEAESVEDVAAEIVEAERDMRAFTQAHYLGAVEGREVTAEWCRRIARARRRQLSRQTIGGMLRGALLGL